MPTFEQGPHEPLISLEWLIWIHTVAIEEFGGATGIRDRALLESALARPPATPKKRAAALAESLVLNHGFVDGNKRTAMYAMAGGLEREGFGIDSARGGLRDLALAIAKRKMDLDQIATWLEKHSRTLSG